MEENNIKIGAYEAGSWNGIVFLVNDQAAFQLRVGTLSEYGDYLDGDINTSYRNQGRLPQTGQLRTKPRDLPFSHSVREVGPHAPDGSYCRLAWNPLYPYDTGSEMVLEWCLADNSTLIGKITYDVSTPAKHHWKAKLARTTDVVVEAYSPWGFSGDYAVRQETIVAQTNYRPRMGEVQWDTWKFKYSSKDPSIDRVEEAGYKEEFFKPSFNDQGWQIVKTGAYWQEDPGIEAIGYGWYRQSVIIPEEWRRKDIHINIGKVSERDWTYLNGVLIGNHGNKDAHRIYTIKPGSKAYDFIRWGHENLITVQVQAIQSPGGMGEGPVLRVYPKNYVIRPRIASLRKEDRRVYFVAGGDRPIVSNGSFNQLQEIQEQMQGEGKLTSSMGKNYAGLHFKELCLAANDQASDNVLHFAAKIGNNEEVLVDNIKRMLASGKIDERIEHKRKRYESRRVKSEGACQGAAEMITNTIGWSTLYAPEQRRTFVVDSRSWVLPDSWVLFGNSATMSSWAAVLEEKELGQNTLRGLLAEQLPDGRVMNAAGPKYNSPDRSQDMYAAYAAWKIYQKWGDLPFLKEVYPRIKAWHEWWFADRGDGKPWRDGNRDGLLELGSNQSPFNAKPAPLGSQEYDKHHAAAMVESYDDSPMWGSPITWGENPRPMPARGKGEEGVRYIFETSTLNISDVVTNNLYALSADMLAHIAHALGYIHDEEIFRQQYGRMNKRINERLWNEDSGLYLNRFWDEYGGKFSYRKSPAVFYALTSGVANESQAQRLVYEHLINPTEFWGKWVLPTISRDDPCFPEQYYWRGAIWPPMTYFTYEGLKRYKFDEVAGELAEKVYNLVKRNWDRDGGLFENYNAIDGWGHKEIHSTLHYSWSACLPMIVIMECIDVEAWGGLRFGSLGLKDTTIKNISLTGHRYSVQVGSSTVLVMEGKELFRADGPVVVRNFQLGENRLSFTIKTKKESSPVWILLQNIKFSQPSKLRGRVNNQNIENLRLTDEGIAFSINPGEHSVELRNGERLH